jgi:hypothetical protein
MWPRSQVLQKQLLYTFKGIRVCVWGGAFSTVYGPSNNLLASVLIFLQKTRFHDLKITSFLMVRKLFTVDTLSACAMSSVLPSCTANGFSPFKTLTPLLCQSSNHGCEEFSDIREKGKRWRGTHWSIFPDVHFRRPHPCGFS